jgi:hypothetical protein
LNGSKTTQTIGNLDDIIKDIFFNIKINILNRFRLHDLTYQTHNLDHKLYWV